MKIILTTSPAPDLTWSPQEVRALEAIELAHQLMETALKEMARFEPDAAARWREDVARLGLARDIINHSRRPRGEWDQ